MVGWLFADDDTQGASVLEGQAIGLFGDEEKNGIDNFVTRKGVSQTLPLKYLLRVARFTSAVHPV